MHNPSESRAQEGVAWQNIKTAEVEFLNNLADKGGLADPVPGMLRHCARLIVGQDLRDRFKLAARTLIRGERGADGKKTRPIYAEDLETLHDVLQVLEALAAIPKPATNQNFADMQSSIESGIERNALAAGECPRDSRVVLLRSLRRIFGRNPNTPMQPTKDKDIVEGKALDGALDELCCDVCHEPLADECACQHEYRREHDSGAER